jgi:integrase
MRRGGANNNKKRKSTGAQALSARYAICDVLRASEACDLRWDDIDLAARTVVIRRLKGSRDSTHYLERDELAGLRRLPRQGAYVFINERGQPFGRMGVARLTERAGQAAGLPFPRSRAHAAPFLRLRPGEQGDGYAKAPALPRPCLNHEHGEVQRDEPRAIQGYLAVASLR